MRLFMAAQAKYSKVRVFSGSAFPSIRGWLGEVGSSISNMHTKTVAPLTGVVSAATVSRKVPS